MARHPVDPPRGASERAIRTSMLIQIAVQCFVGVLVFSPLLFDLDDGAFDVVRVGLFVVWVAAFAFFLLQFWSLGSWRSLPVAPDEEMLWGTVASLARPTGGFGHGGQFSLSTRRLRFRPGLIGRLRGAAPAEWPAAAFTVVRVTSGKGRVSASGRWVVIESEDGSEVALVSSEPRAVADDLDAALKERLRR